MSKLPMLPADPEPYRVLGVAILEAADADLKPTCAGREEPYSDDDKERAMVARDWCPACPVASACFVAGRQEKHGVWGGLDRTKKPARTAKEPR